MLTIGAEGDAPFALPEDVVTQAIAILARRSGGKTYLAKVLAEELIGAGLPVVAVDPVGVFWGLRSNDAGDGPGLGVTILGGEHGDLPLEETGGALVADLIADQPVAMVLDLSGFHSKAAQRRFVTDFAERLYRAKAARREPLMLILDEADEFAPQRPQHGDQRMLGAFETLVRRGRARGIGVTMISQRPAVINKNVLSQLEVLIVLQITAPQDRKAIDEWLRDNTEDDQRKALLAALPGLKQGEAALWSPSWLETFARFTVRAARTFDSSATPKAGEERVEPRGLADVDLAALKDAMAETIERSERDDPKRLHARIRELERVIKSREPVVERVVERVEVPVVPAKATLALAALQDALGGVAGRMIAVAEAACTEIIDASRVAETALLAPQVSAAERRPDTSVRPADTSVRPAADSRIGKAELKLLSALYRHGPLARRRLAAVTGYSPVKSTLRNALSSLRGAGFISDRKDVIELTSPGANYAADHATPLPTGPELLAFWRDDLGDDNADRRVFDALVQAWPDPLDKATLARRARIDDPEKSTLRNALSRLRSLGLVDGMRADDDLMAAIR